MEPNTQNKRRWILHQRKTLKLLSLWYCVYVGATSIPECHSRDAILIFSSLIKRYNRATFAAQNRMWLTGDKKYFYQCVFELFFFYSVVVISRPCTFAAYPPKLGHHRMHTVPHSWAVKQKRTFFNISINHLSFTLIWHDKTLGCCSHFFYMPASWAITVIALAHSYRCLASPFMHCRISHTIHITHIHIPSSHTSERSAHHTAHVLSAFSNTNASVKRKPVVINRTNGGHNWRHR